MTNATDLVPAGGVQIVGRTLLTPAIFASRETVDDILEQIRKEADRFKETRDISTAAGRAAIASFAYKIARSKTALDDLGKDVVSDWKAKANGVDAERRRIREDLDALKDDVRAPLDEWETKDKRRCEQHENALVALRALTQFSTFEPTKEMIGHRVKECGFILGRNWEEFADRAGRIGMSVADELEKLLKEATRREEDQAEHDRLERERQAREQAEREERIAREAREAAERREREAVEAARRETEAAERRARDLEERRKHDAEQAGRQRVMAHESAIALIRAAETADPANTSAFLSERLEGLEVYVRNREWEEFTDAAVAAYESATASLEQKIAMAKAREERDRADREARIAEQARLAEVARQVEAARLEEEEAARRESNKRIRNRVRRQIAEAIVRAAEANIAESQTTEGLADVITTALLDGKIPNVTVTF